jgi:hypothetical protein
MRKIHINHAPAYRHDISLICGGSLRPGRRQTVNSPRKLRRHDIRHCTNIGLSSSNSSLSLTKRHHELVRDCRLCSGRTRGGAPRPRHRTTAKRCGLFEIFELLRLKFAQFGEEFSNHEWTPIDTNRSVQFVFIRVHSRFLLIVCGCGYAALRSSVLVRCVPSPSKARRNLKEDTQKAAKDTEIGSF